MISRIFCAIFLQNNVANQQHYCCGRNGIAVQLFIDIIRNKIPINSLNNFHEFYVCSREKTTTTTENNKVLFEGEKKEIPKIAQAQNAVEEKFKKKKSE